MLFLGMANAYIMRTNMSVAIGENNSRPSISISKTFFTFLVTQSILFTVAMVNHTAISPDPELFDDECPDTDYGNSTVEHQDGEFDWSTSKQGWILSSFFYGYVLTQVIRKSELGLLRVSVSTADFSLPKHSFIEFQCHGRLIAIESDSFVPSRDTFRRFHFATSPFIYIGTYDVTQTSMNHSQNTR